MSIHVDPAVIEPRKGKREEPLPPLGILVFSPQDFSSFTRCLSSSCNRPHKIYFSDICTGIYEGIPVAVIGPMLGAPQSVMILERLIALGIREVVGVGWCGSLQSDVCIGDLVLPASSISEEGTSVHYPIIQKYPGPAESLLYPLRRTYEEASLKCCEGRVWTTDAPYRETINKVLAYQEQGILAVEMETSALFTVAHFRNIHLAMVLVVSDELSTLEWRHGFRDKKFLEVRERLPELTIKALCASRDEQSSSKTA